MSCIDVRQPTAPYIAAHQRTATCVAPYVHVRACRMRRYTVPYAVWTGLKDHQQRRYVCSNDFPWDNDRRSTSFAQRTACWPPRVMQFNDYLMRKTHYKTSRYFSLRVLYAPWLPELYFWLKLCVLYSNFYGTCCHQSPCQIEVSSLTIPQILGWSQNCKSGWRDPHDPFWPNFAFCLFVPLVIYVHAKFEVSSFNHFRDVEGVSKF